MRSNCAIFPALDRAWLDDYENQLWDMQFGAELAAGKLDSLTKKAPKMIKRDLYERKIG